MRDLKSRVLDARRERHGRILIELHKYDLYIENLPSAAPCAEDTASKPGYLGATQLLSLH